MNDAQPITLFLCGPVKCEHEQPTKHNELTVK
jgi:hypothetical protein